jgi:2-polyprenyl-3-methyl-5-hydroxy-6-metoxy-1,4-benzoquinol methylase
MNRIEQNIKLTEEKYERFLQNKMQDPGVEKFYKIISRIKPFVTRLDDPYILDIGCRAGIFFDILKEIGYNNFFGTELSNK